MCFIFSRDLSRLPNQRKKPSLSKRFLFKKNPRTPYWLTLTWAGRLIENQISFFVDGPSSQLFYDNHFVTKNNSFVVKFSGNFQDGILEFFRFQIVVCFYKCGRVYFQEYFCYVRNMWEGQFYQRLLFNFI